VQPYRLVQPLVLELFAMCGWFGHRYLSNRCSYRGAGA
jgi:hypothetical protein